MLIFNQLLEIIYLLVENKFLFVASKNYYISF
ncbi:MAG: hypothetical protein MRERC_3c004 [Mycoplasmataceae bacterium RC_NB112A]|nr:MAG: hypothetical protein MRERC_9c085 [Mycoplasmataceae bacterium RC_NB112A]KLL02184.1 MAG: hypothetical protein MRERC_3c004 [Mycoplasmataceae bacterium RC_NB112A]